MIPTAYAGVGSRETPMAVCREMASLAQHLGSYGWTLRSGGAEGADAAFEMGLSRHHKRQIFLPWEAFNGHKSILFNVSKSALEIAEKHHPAWSKLTPAAKLLHGRNVYQVLGRTLCRPAAFVVCWTVGGKGGGGTGQAIRIARAYGVPVFDLGLYNIQTVRRQIRSLTSVEGLA